MAIQFESSIDVDGRGIIGSGNTIGTINASIIGANNNATTLSTVDSNTNTIIGDSNSGRYGNTVITDRTFRLGRADNTGATSSNTTGILNFNDSVLANAAYSNVGGITGYFPPPTTSNNYYFFNALDENVDTNVFQTGASPTASRFSMSSDPSLSCIGQKFDANTTTGGAVYITASNNSSTASSRGIFTFDARHQNQNSTVPDGHSLFEVTSGYGQTKFLIKQVDGQTNVGIGTTSPSEKLHVAGNMRLENQLYDSTNSQGTNNDVLTKVSAGTEWKSISDIPENVTGSGTTNYIPKWSNSSTLTDSGIVETSTLTTINNASFEYDYSGTTFLNIDGTTGTFLLGQPSTASRVYIHGIQTHLRFYTNNVKAGEFDSSQNFYVPNGNVGIGPIVGNPSAKLDVLGNAVIGSDSNSATGTWAVAIGNDNTASGLDALATGELTTASGRQSFSGGFDSTASGDASFAVGGGTTASGENAFAAGGTTVASGISSAAFGAFSEATATNSFAINGDTTASGESSFSLGVTTNARGLASIASGLSCNTGTGANGAFAGGTVANANGAFSIAYGDVASASGRVSQALGYIVNAGGQYSFAQGFNNTASGTAAAVFGQQNTSSGTAAWSLTTGFLNTTRDSASLTVGSFNGMTASSASREQFMLGRYLNVPRNSSGTPSAGCLVVGEHNAYSNRPDVKFAVGTGVGVGAEADSFTVLKDGNVLMEQIVNKNYSSDSAAASGGVPVGGIYHNAGDLKIRLT